MKDDHEQVLSIYNYFLERCGVHIGKNGVDYALENQGNTAALLTLATVLRQHKI